MPATPPIQFGPACIDRPVHRRAVGRAAAVGMLLLGLILVGATPAAAHSELESTLPAADTTVTEPLTSVTLTFDDGVQPDFAQVAVLDPAGNDTVDGDPVIDGNTVTQPVSVTTAGAHSVSYRIVSADGHIVQGSYAFTAAVVSPQPAAPTSSPEPTSPVTTPPAEAAASPAAQAEQEGGTGQTVAILGVLAVGLIATVLITAARRRQRRG